RVHDVAKYRAVFGVGVEVESAAGRTKLVLDRPEDLMTVVDERMIVRPYFLDDLHARVLAVRMNGDEPAAGAERARQRRDHALGLELQRGAGAIGLRGDHQVVIGGGAAGPGDD